MMGKDERDIVFDMEGNISKLKAFSDILISASMTDELPNATSLNTLADLMLKETESLYDKFVELIDAFHEADREDGELPDLHPAEVMNLVMQTDEGKKGGQDAIFEAYTLGVSMTAESLRK